MSLQRLVQRRDGLEGRLAALGRRKRQQQAQLGILVHDIDGGCRQLPRACQLPCLGSLVALDEGQGGQHRCDEGGTRQDRREDPPTTRPGGLLGLVLISGRLKVGVFVAGERGAGLPIEVGREAGTCEKVVGLAIGFFPIVHR